jgi:hypothetical protein
VLRGVINIDAGALSLASAVLAHSMASFKKVWFS